MPYFDFKHSFDRAVYKIAFFFMILGMIVIGATYANGSFLSPVGAAGLSLFIALALVAILYRQGYKNDLYAYFDHYLYRLVNPSLQLVINGERDLKEIQERLEVIIPPPILELINKSNRKTKISLYRTGRFDPVEAERVYREMAMDCPTDEELDALHQHQQDNNKFLRGYMAGYMMNH